jgi:hypothetical protein
LSRSCSSPLIWRSCGADQPGDSGRGDRIERHALPFGQAGQHLHLVAVAASQPDLAQQVAAALACHVDSTKVAPVHHCGERHRDSPRSGGGLARDGQRQAHPGEEPWRQARPAARQVEPHQLGVAHRVGGGHQRDPGHLRPARLLRRIGNLDLGAGGGVQARSDAGRHVDRDAQRGGVVQLHQGLARHRGIAELGRHAADDRVEGRDERVPAGLRCRAGGLRLQRLDRLGRSALLGLGAIQCAGAQELLCDQLPGAVKIARGRRELGPRSCELRRAGRLVLLGGARIDAGQQLAGLDGVPGPHGERNHLAGHLRGDRGLAHRLHLAVGEIGRSCLQAAYLRGGQRLTLLGEDGAGQRRSGDQCADRQCLGGACESLADLGGTHGRQPPAAERHAARRGLRTNISLYRYICNERCNAGY